MLDEPLSILLLEDDAADQQIVERELRKHLIGKEDIEQYMRQSANVDEWSDMKSATLERSGQIGIVKKKKQ